jgi:MFS family permease
MSEYIQALRAFGPSLRRFLLTTLCMTMVPFGIMAVLFNLYLLRLGFDARYIGLLAGLGQLVWAAAALPAGMLSNRIGLRNSIMTGNALFGAALASMLLVELLPRELWETWLLGGQILLNIGVAMLTVNIPPYMMAVTGERERKHAFSVLAALIPAAAFLGSVIAGVLPGMLARQGGLSLEEAQPYRLALWLGPLLCWVSLLPLLGADRGRVVVQAGAGGTKERAPLGLLAFWTVTVFFASMGEGAVRTFFNVFLDMQLNVLPATIGFVMGVAQLLPIAVALALPLLMLRWGTGYTLLGAILMLAACLVPIALAGTLWVAAGAYVAVVATFTAVGTTRDLFGQELVTPRWRTSSQGMAMIGMALGWATAGVVGGALIESVGFGALFLAGAAAAVLAAALLWGHLRRAPKDAVEPVFVAPESGR